MSALRSLHRDERGIVTSFLVKLVLSFAVVALVLIDGTAIVLNRLQTDDVAQIAAKEAAKTYEAAGNVQSVREVVVRTLEERNPTAKMRSVVIRTDGSVAVTITRRADTLLAERIGFLEGLTVAEVRSIGRPSLLN